MIYWFISLTNATNKLVPEYKTMNGYIAVFVCMLTLGLYLIYWNCILGKKVGKIKHTDSSGGLYVLLFLAELGIVPLCMAQKAVNKVVTGNLTLQQ